MLIVNIYEYIYYDTNRVAFMHIVRYYRYELSKLSKKHPLREGVFNL